MKDVVGSQSLNIAIVEDMLLDGHKLLNKIEG